MSDRNLFIGITIIVLLLIGCASPAPVYKAKCIPSSQIYEKGTGIAVWDIEVTSPTGSMRMDPFLSGKIIQKVIKEGHYDVITRDRLLVLLKELNLDTSLLADERTRLKLGKIVGAKLMVFGDIIEIVYDRMMIHLRLVEVETGKILTAVEKYYNPTPSDLSERLKAVEEMTSELFVICQ
ncbi:MAG: penicillin-binding protein activator LpoB [Desulfobacterales bacterium]|nr:penicillin-binding protein activator LpoB [Desulfobacterales bacterium]